MFIPGAQICYRLYTVHKRHLQTIGTLAGIVFFLAVVIFLSKNSHLIGNFLISTGPLAPIVALLLYPLLALTPIPNDPITIIIGVTYGPVAGVIIATLGNTLSALVEYAVAAKIGKRFNLKEEKKKLPFGLGHFSVNSVFLLLVGRTIPGYGSKVISFLAGTEGVPMRRYLWTSLATSLLGAVVLSYGGFGLVEILKRF